MIARFTNYQELSAFAADKIIKLVQQKPAAVLCLAGGDTPALTYDKIVEKAHGSNLNPVASASLVRRATFACSEERCEQLLLHR